MKLVLLIILSFIVWVGWRAWNTGTLPTAGENAPDFHLPDQHGKLHSLSDYAGRWLVLYFYPKDDTPGCTREACAFRDGLARLETADAVVVGISVDTLDSHRKFAEKYRLSFDLLADTDGHVARHYGVLMDWKIFRMAKRTTFLIDPAGKVQQVYERVDPDRHADEILAELAKAVQ